MDAAECMYADIVRIQNGAAVGGQFFD